jgi:hypothetical protein
MKSGYLQFSGFDLRKNILNQTNPVFKYKINYQDAEEIWNIGPDAGKYSFERGPYQLK